MPYYPLEVPPGTHPALERIVHEQIDTFLREVHAMFRLPIADEPGLDAKCNFSAVLVLLGVVAGVSTTLYDDSTSSGLDPQQQSGEAFRRVLTHRYPWDEEPAVEGAIRKQHAATVLYEAFRNPLAHSLGILGPNEVQGHGQRKVAKGAMSEEKIEAIERSHSRPAAWTGPTLRTDSPTKTDRTKTVLDVKLFYWGVRRMIWNVLAARNSSGEVIPSEAISMTATATSTSVIPHLDGGSPE